jgi:hypothetical protein
MSEALGQVANDVAIIAKVLDDVKAKLHKQNQLMLSLSVLQVGMLVHIAGILERNAAI